MWQSPESRDEAPVLRRLTVPPYGQFSRRCWLPAALWPVLQTGTFEVDGRAGQRSHILRHLRQQGHAFFRIDFAFFRLLQLDNTLEQLGLNKAITASERAS